MPQLVNASSWALNVFAPEAAPDSLLVEPGQQITIPDELGAEQPDDAYLTGEGDQARLWPHSLWRLADAPPGASGAPASSTPEPVAPASATTDTSTPPITEEH